jgi:hypothetical protein
MADEAKKIIVDDDWKAEAKREKERLASQAEKPPPLPPPNIAELINIVVMQAMAGLGLLAGPNGDRIPPDLELAKHYIDLLQIVEEKTRGNLTTEEKQLLDQVLYETRMIFVQVSSGGAPPPGPGPAA